MGCVWSQSATLTDDEDPSSKLSLKPSNYDPINTGQIAKIETDRNISIGSSTEKVQTEMSCNTPVADNTIIVENIASDVIFTSKATVEDIFNNSQQGGVINFSSLIMVNSIRAVLRSQLISLDSLLELFQIYDKDSDGWLQLSEFIEFVEIIDLSYGHLLPETNSAQSRRSSKPLRRITYKGPVETLTPYHSVSSAEEIFGFNSASHDSYDDESGSKVAVVTASSVHYVTSPGVAATETRIHNSGGQPQSHSKRKFITPVLETQVETTDPSIEPQPMPLSSPVTTISEEIKKTANSATPRVRNRMTNPLPQMSTPDHIAAAVAASGILSPSAKKGFMVKQEEKGDGSPAAAKANRFFTLNDGSLTYYDSTTKTPPFSLDRRTIALSGMSVTVVGDNVLQLRRGDLTCPQHVSPGGSPSSISTGIFSPSRDSSREVLSLMIKSSLERDDWIRALQAHIDFSTSLDRAAGPGRDSQPILQPQPYELFRGSSRSEVDVA